MSSSGPILVTGAAGFIGFHLAKRLIKDGHSVIGLDNLNHYYDPALKEARLNILKENDNYIFYKEDLKNRDGIDQIFSDKKPAKVVHLAAQAGVRYSIINPQAYIDSNISGFMNILEACRHHPVEHLIFASSSSVYGANTKMPFSVHDNVDHQVSLYGATKKANELMAHTYSNLYNIPSTGLRFFTVYGPWGRPDMALFLFTRAILEGKPIDVYNFGDMERDFTYIDDIVESLVRLLPKTPSANSEWSGDTPDPATSFNPYRLYNIGNNSPVKLMEFIQAIEQSTGKKAEMNLMPMQDGDVPKTWADTEDLYKTIDFRPSTPIDDGVEKFVIWYRKFYHLI